MENLQALDNDQCGELERLAAAAATMDYTHTLPPAQTQPSPENSSHPTGPLLAPHHNQMVLERQLRPSQPITSIPQVISYIEPYQVPKGHHLVPLRGYDSQSFTQNEVQGMQSLAGSRVVMVAANNRIPPSNVQLQRPVSHFTVGGVQYEMGNGPHESSTHSYSHVLSHSTQILHFTPIEETAPPSSPVPFVADSLNDSITSVNEPLPEAKEKRRNNDMRKMAENIPNKLIDSDCPQAESSKPLEKTHFPCRKCKSCLKDEDEPCKQHQMVDHGLPTSKRNGLPLELKIEIIKRINSGERKADMAEEYGVNTSTIKSIMKKADTYLMCWKKGLFKPDSKKLKGPKREDVEEALFSWYKQALDNGAAVSGAILCAKAIDFAKKLGHADFKPTHGWLDRFKKRKKIMFGRGASKRKREDKTTQDCISSFLPQMLIDYEPMDIFAVELLGLFYRALPSAAHTLKCNRCPGGVKSRERLSLIMCTNMNGSEKFPLVVVGCPQKATDIKTIKNLPVHYILDKHSWITSEIFTSWLFDLDSWFFQLGRKVILLAPPSPVYANPPKCRALKFVVMPIGYPSPLKQIVVPYFKKYYRKKFLEESMLVVSREGKCPKSFSPHLTFLQCLQLLASAWQSLPDGFIVNSFQRSGLTKYGLWGMIVPTDTTDTAGLQEMFLRAFHILEDTPPPEMTFSDFVHFDDEVQVCNLMGDDDILAKVKGIMDENDEYFEDKENDGLSPDQVSLPLFSEVENALGVIRRYIQYQEGAQEMFQVLAHLEYFIYKILYVPDHSPPNQLPN